MKDNILIRGIRIIEELAFNGSLSVEKIYKETNISRSAIYRILCILEELNYVSRYRSGAEDLWKLDLKFLSLSSSILSRLDLRNEVRDILKKLADETKEIVQLGVLHNNKVLFLDVIKRHKSLVSVANIGDAVDLNLCVAGFAIAAYLEKEELDLLLSKSTFIRYTKNTLTDRKEIEKELKKVRNLGYAFDDQRYAIGHRCIGAPVYDYTNKVIAAINISGHVSTITEDKIEKLAAIVKKRAREASIRMGYIANRNP